MSELSHFDASGQAAMVDVSAKPASRRAATASAFVELSEAALAALPANPKGNPLEVARFAGIQAAKRTAELIPMCPGGNRRWRGSHHGNGCDRRPDRSRDGGPHSGRRGCADCLRHDQGSGQGYCHSHHSTRGEVRREERGVSETLARNDLENGRTRRQMVRL